MNEQLGALAFISVFHIIGGAALGATIRGLMDRPSGEAIGGRIFFLIWGAGFGCMPLMIGLQESTRFLAAQIIVLSIAFGVTFFWLEMLRDIMSNPNLAQMSFGGLFLLVGLVSGFFLLRNGELVPAALFGGLFSLAGGAVFLGGMRAALQSSDRDE